MLCLKPSIEAFSSLLLGCTKVNNSVQILHLYTYLCNVGLKAHTSLESDIVSVLVEATSWCPTCRTDNWLTCTNGTVIIGHSKYGDPQHTLSLPQQIVEGGFYSSRNICLKSLLKACAAFNTLDRAITLHVEIARSNLPDALIGSALIQMYTRCNSLQRAHDVFHKLVLRDVLSWNALIGSCLEQGLCKESLSYFHQMQSEGVAPNATTVICCLKACSTIRCISSGFCLHSEIAKKGYLEQSNGIGTALVDMYAKCGDLAEAEHVFGSVPCKDTFTQMSLLAGYANHGHDVNVLECLNQMQDKGIHFNAVTYVCCLKACSSIEAFDKAQELHAEIVRTGLFNKSMHICSTLVHTYSKCGYLTFAKEVFDSVQSPNEISWNAIIGSYAEWGLCAEAIDNYEQMLLKGFFPDLVTYICSLKACSCIGDLQRVLAIHSEAVKRGFETDAVLGTTIVDSYAKASSPNDAQQVLDGMHFRSSVTWNALIAAYADQGLGAEILTCYRQMQLDSVNPDAITFVFCIRACGLSGVTDIGQIFHGEAIKMGVELDLLVGGTLIDMYCRFGWFSEAQVEFGRLLIWDGVSWNALIAGYVDCGYFDEALKHLERMENEGVSRDEFSLVCGLKACSSSYMIAKGQEMHMESVKKGMLERDNYLSSALVNMYALCESLQDALAVVVHSTNVTSWNALMTGLTERIYCQDVLDYYECMLLKGIVPDEVTFLSILRVCGVIKVPKEGQTFHTHIIQRGLETESQLGSTLVDMYGKLGFLAEAEDIFKKLPVRSVVSWNVLIANYLEQGDSNQVFSYFVEMELEGIAWDAGTAVSCLKAGANMGLTDGVRKIHAEVLRKGLETSNLVANTLIAVCAEMCLLNESHYMFWKIPFKDKVAWNAFIAGNVEQGQAKEAFYLFEEMQTAGICPDEVTFTFILKACGQLQCRERGRQIHINSINRGLVEADVFVGTALIDMYITCGLLTDAQGVFDRLLQKSLVSWNTLLSGYVPHGLGEEALNLFERMQRAGIVADSVTASCILKACSSFKNLIKSRKVHAFITKVGFDREPVVGNIIVDVYDKCNSLLEARNVFDRLLERDIVSWTTLLSTYTGHGVWEEALDCFERMQREGVLASEVTFACALKACGNSGSLTKAHILHSQIMKVGLEGELHIGNTLVDMYSKCGVCATMQQVFDGHLLRDIIACNALIAGYAQLGETEAVFSTFNDLFAEGMSPDAVTFTSVLNSCINAGLVVEGMWFFQGIGSQFGFIPSLDHYTCMVDLLGRAGNLDGAISCIEWMPFQPGILPWQILLGACRKWGDALLGQHAFDHTVWLDANAASSYICLLNLYADVEIADNVQERWDKRNAELELCAAG